MHHALIKNSRLLSSGPPLRHRPALRALPCKAQRPWRRTHPHLPAVASDSSQAQPQAPTAEDEEAEKLAKQGWDPHGVLPPLEALGTIDHFERRQRQRQQQQQQQQQQQAAGAAAAPPTPPAPAAAVVPIHSAPESSPQQATTLLVPPPATEHPQQQQQQQAHPHLAFDPSATDAVAALSERLLSSFMPVDLSAPGVSVLSVDPPVLLLRSFLPDALCDKLIAEAGASGRLAPSLVGAGNAASAGGSGNAYTGRRTSESMLLDGGAAAVRPALGELLAEIQHRARRLLGAGAWWGATGRMPLPGQYTFESPQVARYSPGQHFLAHEDAFPARLAAANGFQRHATLLLYLNDVAQGGATRFDLLNLKVQPVKGAALLFFPAFADGTPDERSLHTATDAVDTKWVMQQWIARGWGAAPAPVPSQQAAGEKLVEVFTVAAPAGVPPVAKRGGPGGGGSKARGGKAGKKKGFGA